MKRPNPHILLTAIAIMFSLLTVSCLQKKQNAEAAKQTTEAPKNKSAQKMARKKADKNKPLIKQPVVAGAFYPASPSELQRMLDEFFSKAEKKIDEPIFGLIAPHAGYIYSGPCAAWAYKQVMGKRFSRVVVLAPSHYVRLRGASVLDMDFYQTPIGRIPIDRKMVKTLISKYDVFKYDPALYAREHSMEVHLPFLQKTISVFKLVPIIIGTHDWNVLDSIAEALKKEIGNDSGTLFVASTDLSHYHPYDDAKQRDERTLYFIQKGDPKALLDAEREGKAELCGLAPVVVLLDLYKKLGGNKIVRLHYENSGDTAGSKDRVVGYGALALIRPKITAKMSSTKSVEDNPHVKQSKMFSLTKEEKDYLLEVAKKTVQLWVNEKKKYEPEPLNEKMKKKGAAFVTLKKKSRLRGCIGHVFPVEPLYLSVRDNAISAASRDPRFPPVGPEELKDITIEVSVLTPPVVVKSLDEIEVGKHGLIMERDFRRGLLLPQVPGEFGWNKEQFLQHTCMKAALAPDCYKDSKTIIKKFEAIVFGEE